ncbi:hypothetical protein WG66_002021 [Moniliophthora roreri]|nr:hypothetical protein WG66_002021 [Moniliophthora roreri]
MYPYSSAFLSPFIQYFASHCPWAHHMETCCEDWRTLMSSKSVLNSRPWNEHSLIQWPVHRWCYRASIIYIYRDKPTFHVVQGIAE